MKRLIAIAFIFLFFIIAAREATAQIGYRSRAVRVVTLSPEADESKSFYTLAGEVVEIKNEVNGDIYVAANQIVLQGVVNGDILAVGEEILIEGKIRGNLRAVAGKIILSGEVTKNVTVMAGVVETLPGSIIGGGVISISEKVGLHDFVGGQVKILAEDVSLENYIGSDVEIWSKNLYIASGAELSDLTYYSENTANIDPEASISGRLLKGRNTFFNKDPDFSGFRNLFDRYTSGAGVVFHIFSFLWALVWGLVILRFFPKTLDIMTSTLDKKPLKSLFFGLLLLFILPVLIIILVVSLVGIPLAVFLLFIFALVLYLAKIHVSFWLGKKIIKDANKTYTALILGLFIYYVLIYLQSIGWLIAFMVLLLGTGSFVIGAYTQYKNLVKRKMI
jgi:hypothetical protein